jgi:hypothetical protein
VPQAVIIFNEGFQMDFSGFAVQFVASFFIYYFSKQYSL